MDLLDFFLTNLLIKWILASKFSAINQGLTSVPNGIPSDTEEIELNKNSISSISTSKISHLSKVKVFTIPHNDLTELPDLCVLGETLKFLDLYNNPISDFPTVRFSCLNVLTELNINQVDVTYFPDLSSIGDTLLRLKFYSSVYVPVTESDLQPLTRIEELHFEKAQLPNFPDVKTIGNTLIHLGLKHNDITFIPQDVIASMVAIKNLDIEHNKLKSNPNICQMKDTLIDFDLRYNLIQQIIPEYITCLTNLKRLKIGGTDLHDIDDLNLTLLRETLEELTIKGSSITKLPEMKNMTYLKNLFLNKNPLTSEFLWDFFEGWSSLKSITSTESTITKFPNFFLVSETLLKLELRNSQLYQLHAGNIGSLTKLEYYDLNNAQFEMQFIPAPCSVDQSNLEIKVKGVNVDLCACRHVWIKMAEELGATVEMDSIACYGTNWNSVTSSFLYGACDKSLPYVQGVKAKRASRNFLCTFPLGKILSGMTVTRCLQECFLTHGCYTFNLSSSGVCVILSPTTTGKGLQVQGLETEWNYYEVIGKELK